MNLGQMVMGIAQEGQVQLLHSVTLVQKATSILPSIHAESESWKLGSRFM